MSQLCSFILLNYYFKFLSNLANILAPLYSLLQKDKRRLWGSDQKAAFEKAKCQFTSERLLVHYDMNKKNYCYHVMTLPIYGIEALLCQKMPNRKQQLIAIVSHSLLKPEQKYARFDKEGLAIVFRVNKFHQYLFDCKFTAYILRS